MDESPRRSIAETRVPAACAPNRPQRADYEHERCGACNVFMSNEPLAGARTVQVAERKTKADWAVFVEQIARQYSEAEKITLVMDNPNAHRTASLHEAFSPEKAKAPWDRFEFVHTPKHGSRLNMAEIELNVLVGQCLKRRIAEIETVRSEVGRWERRRNNRHATINWRFQTEDARIKLKRLYPTLDN